MIAVVHRGGRRPARALRATAIALALTAIGVAIAILINLITTPPLPGWLRWLKPGWRQVTALVVLGAASAVIAVFARRADKDQPTAIQCKSQPKLQPHYDENSAQYRKPYLTTIWKADGGQLGDRPTSELVRHERW